MFPRNINSLLDYSEMALHEEERIMVSEYGIDNTKPIYFITYGKSCNCTKCQGCIETWFIEFLPNGNVNIIQQLEETISRDNCETFEIIHFTRLNHDDNNTILTKHRAFLNSPGIDTKKQRALSLFLNELKKGYLDRYTLALIYLSKFEDELSDICKKVYSFFGKNDNQ